MTGDELIKAGQRSSWAERTQLAGAEDRDHARARPVKAVYMYELEPRTSLRRAIAVWG